jgi:hypothetical protein
VAEHTARSWGRPWSGTPDGLVRQAERVQEVVRSASHARYTTLIVVQFTRRNQSIYRSLDEFVVGMASTDLRTYTGLLLQYKVEGDRPIEVAVHLRRGLFLRPFCTATTDDWSIALGVAKQVASTFGGHGLWGGLRRSEVSRFQRVGARVGGLGTVALTAVISAAATLLLRRAFTGHW